MSATARAARSAGAIANSASGLRCVSPFAHTAMLFRMPSEAVTTFPWRVQIIGQLIDERPLRGCQFTSPLGGFGLVTAGGAGQRYSALITGMK